MSKALFLFLGFSLLLIASVAIQNLGFSNPVFSLFRKLPHFDKVGHFLLMGGLNFLAILAIAPRFPSRRVKASLWISAVVTVLVALEELSQGFVAGRTLSAFDFLASLLGMITFGLLGYLLIRRKKQRAA